MLYLTKNLAVRDYCLCEKIVNSNYLIKVVVPKNAVGVVIGKGGDMIKKIQMETGAKVQFRQLYAEVQGDQRSVFFENFSLLYTAVVQSVLTISNWLIFV